MADNSTRTAQRHQRTLPGDDAVVCKCNVDAIQLTVRKEGPNQGLFKAFCLFNNCMYHILTAFNYLCRTTFLQMR